MFPCGILINAVSFMIGFPSNVIMYRLITLKFWDTAEDSLHTADSCLRLSVHPCTVFCGCPTSVQFSLIVGMVLVSIQFLLSEGSNNKLAGSDSGLQLNRVQLRVRRSCDLTISKLSLVLFNFINSSYFELPSNMHILLMNLFT